MTRTRSRSRSRLGFTLVELLVVIAIIAILVSLTAGAALKVLGKIPEVQTRTEIGMMEASLQSFMTDYGLSDPPPSYLILREDLAYPPAEIQHLQFLKKVFGKNLGPTVDWNGDGTITLSTSNPGKFVLEGEQCLVFYLGGIPTGPTVTTPGCLGFSTNNQNPSMTGGRRNGPYMNFNSSRLVAGPGGFFMYIDGWNVKGAPKPYAYFSSNGLVNGYNANTNPSLNDCPTILALPYRDLSGNFMNNNRYQIISAGKDGLFGTGQWDPSAGATGPDADNQANFASGVLGAGQ